MWKGRRAWQRRGLVCAGLVFLAVAGAGCGSDPKPLPVETIDSYPYRLQRENVEVGVEPWTDREHVDRLFRHTPDKPVIAVRLTIANRGTSTLRFSHTTAELQSAALDRPAVHVVPPGELTGRLYDDGSGLATVVIIATLGLGAPISGAIMGAGHDSSLHDQHRVFQTKMDLVTIDPGQQMTGFLFFDDSDAQLMRKHAKEPLTLRLTRLVRQDQEPLHFEFQLKSL